MELFLEQLIEAVPWLLLMVILQYLQFSILGLVVLVWL